MDRRPLVAAVALAAAFAGRVPAAQAQEPRTVTLAEALRLAGSAQPSVVLAQQNLRVAEAQARQANAAFLPSVSTSVTTSTNGGSRVNQFGVPVSVNSYYSSNLGISASWDLFTGFRRGAQRSSTRAGVEQQEASMLQQQFTVALNTKQAFYAALQAAELVGVQQAQLRLATEQVRLVTERLRLGATTRSDSLTAVVTQGNAQLALINAQSAVITAQANLARAIQVPGLVMAVPDTTLEARVPAIDTAALLRDALAQAPAVRQADAAAAAAAAQRSVMRAAYLPTANLSVGNTWAAGLPPAVDSTGKAIPGTGTGSPFSGTYASGWNMRLTISYPLFNNLSRETGYLSADATVQTTAANARDARLALQASLLQLLSALGAAARGVDVSRVSVAAAEEAMRMQSERYRLGAVTNIEVLTAQANLEQAQVNLVTARYNYLIARAQIEALVGHGL
jgi:outer membrane protein